MLNALAVFKASLNDARSLSGLYTFISTSVGAPYPADDLLRSQVVYAIGAFDKLMHDIIRIGMVQTFLGSRPATAKYNAEAISLEVHNSLKLATIPPAEILFEQEIARKLGRLSYQDPDKVAEGLSLIWDEGQKWDRIAGVLGTQASPVKVRLKLIAGRRNSIVHESDMQPVTNIKTPITLIECQDIADFIERCGETIVNLVV